jgi:hypothetical protein
MMAFQPAYTTYAYDDESVTTAVNNPHYTPVAGAFTHPMQLHIDPNSDKRLLTQKANHPANLPINNRRWKMSLQEREQARIAAMHKYNRNPIPVAQRPAVLLALQNNRGIAGVQGQQSPPQYSIMPDNIIGEAIIPIFKKNTAINRVDVNITHNAWYNDAEIFNAFNAQHMMATSIRVVAPPRVTSSITVGAQEASDASMTMAVGGCWQDGKPSMPYRFAVCSITVGNIALASNGNQRNYFINNTQTTTAFYEYNLTPICVVSGATRHVHDMAHALNNATQLGTGSYMLVAQPIPNPAGGYWGVASQNNGPNALLYEEYHPPSASVLSPISVNTKAWAMPTTTKTRAFDAPAITAASPSDHCTLDGDVVDATCTAILVDEKGVLREQHSAGIKAQPLLLKPEQVMWPSYFSQEGPNPIIAPAFSAIAATWLDRAVISAITSAASWVGTARAAELDPQTRGSMRAAATSNIELTRYYVRLWALYFAATSALLRNKPMLPARSRPASHCAYEANTFGAWAAALNGAVANGTAPLYLDTNATFASGDLLPILELITADRLTNAGMANWCWPDIAGSKVYTNNPVPTLMNYVVEPSAVIATINWLNIQTETHTQMAHAYQLVQHLAYRPSQWGIWGSAAANSSTLIRLPRANSAGQLLAPFLLANTTSDIGSIELLLNIDPTRLVLAATQAGTDFCYAISQTAALLKTPLWWDASARRHATLSESYSTVTIGQTWHPATCAAQLSLDIGCQYSSLYTTQMMPLNKDMLQRLTAAVSGSALNAIGWKRSIPLQDPAAALFTKIRMSNNGHDILVGQPVRLEVIADQLGVEHCVDLLVGAGARVGYASVSNSTNTISAINYSTLRANHHLRFPHSLSSNVTYIPVVEFHTYQQVFSAINASARRATGQWYLCQATGATAPSFTTRAHSAVPSSSQPTQAAMLKQTETVKYVEAPAPSAAPTAPPKTHEGSGDDDYASASEDDAEDVTLENVPYVGFPDSVAPHGADPLVRALAAAAHDPISSDATKIIKAANEWVPNEGLRGDPTALQWMAERLDNVTSSLHDEQLTVEATKLAPALLEMARLTTMRTEIQHPTAEEQQAKNGSKTTFELGNKSSHPSQQVEATSIPTQEVQSTPPDQPDPSSVIKPAMHVDDLTTLRMTATL